MRKIPWKKSEEDFAGQFVDQEAEVGVYVQIDQDEHTRTARVSFGQIVAVATQKAYYYGSFTFGVTIDLHFCGGDIEAMRRGRDVIGVAITIAKEMEREGRELQVEYSKGGE